MLRFKKIRVLSSLGSEPLGSPGWLAVPTVLVFGLAFLLSWARPLRGQGPGPCSGGPNYCLWNANNACSYLTYKTCAPTGPGYTCWIQGKQYTEGYFSMSVSKTWPRCSTPATLSTMSCTQAPAQCGAMLYCATGNPNCPQYNACTDTTKWYWQDCKAATGSNPC